MRAWIEAISGLNVSTTITCRQMNIVVLRYPLGLQLELQIECKVQST